MWKCRALLGSQLILVPILATTFLAAQPGVGSTENPGYFGFGFEVSADTGLLTVVHVVPDGPAERAGIRPFDVLAAISGTPARFASHRQAINSLRRLPAGVPVELAFHRDGQSLSVIARPAQPPDGLAARNEPVLRCADASLVGESAGIENPPPP